MLKKRQESGFNLAFLDVMACGLGAVILILIIVNFTDDTPIPSDEIEKLEQELAASQSEAQALFNSVSNQSTQANTEQSLAEEEAQRIAELTIQQTGLQQAIADKKAVIAQLQDAIAAAAPETADDTIELPNVNEETYLLGLIVEGRNIGILIDNSASMSDPVLIDIIKRKLGSDSNKRAGPKWQRTLRIVRWMLARLPSQSKVAVVQYNQSASALAGGAANNSEQYLTTLLGEVENLVPKHGTNLQAGLNELQRNMPDMTDLYIVTDGLPSLIEPTSGFSPSRNCNPLPGGQATISGACRIQVMQRTLNENRLAGVRTNIVLLPLEGDSQASAFYWQWASFTGGTFISPALTWP